MPTRPKGVIQPGSLIPSILSSEYLSGPLRMRANAIVMSTTGSSAPPLVTHIGLPLWAVAVAIAMEPMTPRGPRGLSRPRAVRAPPPSSEAIASCAHCLPGFKPSISIKPAVPSGPGPSNDPKAFCAP